MIHDVTNHLWQSTVFALAVGLLTLAFRGNRAQVRYGLWLAASVKFLVPFALLMSLGSEAPRPAVVEKIAPPAVAVAIVQLAEPVGQMALPVAPRRPQIPWLPIAWACGFAAVSLLRLRGWARVRAAVRASSPAGIPAAVEVRSAPGLLEPGVVGVFRQILLLPDGIEEKLTKVQLDAVLAHELCHTRRRDNLSSAIHMISEALFWFHPLVWWIGARLVEERERACDEEVLRLGGDPRDYAEGILNVCKLYVGSPLACVAGVTGSDLKKRIEAIMTNRILVSLTAGKKTALAAAGLMAIALPVAVGVLRAQAAASQTFDAASIRPCELTGPIQDRNGHSSPGRLGLGCDVLVDNNTFLGLIERAYVEFADGREPKGVDREMVTVGGGPGWVHTQGYKIEATADGHPSVGVMSGPMLQRLLEDRFKLQIHRETKDTPVYVLTLDNASKLKPFQEGSCVATPGTPIPWPALPSGQRYCMMNISLLKPSIDADAVTMTDFSKLLNLVVDRHVIDETGMSGKFQIHLTFKRDQVTAPKFGSIPTVGPPPPGLESAAAAGSESEPTIFTAVQEQLGLKLVATKRPVEALVIDSVERPSEN